MTRLFAKPPFGDRCQVCESPATIEAPLQLSRIVERSFDGESGVLLNPFFVSITVARENAVRESARNPLLFCDNCHQAFRRWLVWEAVRLLVLVPLLIIGGAVAFYFARAVGVIAFVILFVVLGRAFGAQRIGRRWEVRLARIPLVSDAISQETELQFVLGKPGRLKGQSAAPST